jgi:hypothetical protein
MTSSDRPVVTVIEGLRSTDGAAYDRLSLRPALATRSKAHRPGPAPWPGPLPHQKRTPLGFTAILPRAFRRFRVQVIALA